jgi:hypothetical protein
MPSKVEKVATDGNAAGTTAPTTTAPKTTTPESFTEGDTVKIDGVEYTLVNAKFVKANQYVEAKNGKVIQIDVKAKNSSDTQKYVSSIDFNVSDSEGNMAESYYGLDNKGFDGDVLAGKALSGNLAFDVKDSASYEITLKPSFTLGHGEAVFKLTKEQLSTKLIATNKMAAQPLLFF